MHNTSAVYRYLFITLLWLLSGCDKVENAATSLAPPAGLPATAVKIAQPLAQQVTDWDEYTGRIEAVNSVEIRARVSGYLQKINFTAGAKVNRGDLLFVIDPRPFKAQLNYAQAELEKAKVRRELAKNDLTRAENLFKAKAISAEEYDTRQKAWREAASTIASAAAQVASAQLNVDYCQIHAPISGRISRELITVGNLVNGSGNDATRLATLVSTNPVYVSVDVDERAILNYRRQSLQQGQLQGAEVELALSDESDFPHLGYLDYIAPSENPATGTINIRARFDNADELLSPGFFARIRLRNHQAYAALLLPERAIVTDQADRFVWVVTQKNTLEHRKVTLGKKIADLRVVQQGLHSGDWVVIDGVMKLKPDSQIAPEKIFLSDVK